MYLKLHNQKKRNELIPIFDFGVRNRVRRCYSTLLPVQIRKSAHIFEDGIGYVSVIFTKSSGNINF